MTRSRETLELLSIEEADAWNEYLTATRLKFGRRYDESEPWVWQRLQQRLKAVKTRRSKVAA